MTNNQYKIFNKVTKREKIQEEIQNVIQDKVNFKELYELEDLNRFVLEQISFFSSLSLTNIDSPDNFFMEYNKSGSSIQNAVITLKDYFVIKYYEEERFIWFLELYTYYQNIFNEFYLWLKYQVIPQLK